MSRRTHARASSNNRRALAQNFMHDDAAIAAVVGTLHPPPGATVVDLGAGAGALTRLLALSGSPVVAVERDPRWVAHLRRASRSWGDVEVVAGDALTVPLPAGPFVVVSNAPYNIGTKLVRRLMTDAHGLVRATVVLQLETARRLAGRPAAGRFAATWAPWFALELGRTIPRSAFRPVPAVDSALLTLAPREVPLLSPAVFAAYSSFLTRVFSGRGRTLEERVAAAMRGGRRGARAVLERAGVERGAVPSRVPPVAYARVFEVSTVAAGRGRVSG